MSDSERAENPSASARSTHVAHFMPPAWPIVASRLAPLIARVDRDAEAVQVLILVPTAPDATALFRALSDLNVAETASIALLATPRRSRRLT